MSESILLKYAAYCEVGSIHPIAKSISKLECNEKLNINNVRELPGFGIIGYYNNIEILVGNYELMVNNNIEIVNCKETGSVLYLAIDKRCYGYVLIVDEIKEEAYEMINGLNKLNIECVILTGDNYATANDVASKLNINKVYAKLLPSDKLEKLIISHDTLLDYAYQLISKYEKLQKILADKYPYIFIDEYQDTNKKIIDLINLIKKQSEKIGKPICIGFFGDSKQNIYEDGIGSEIYSLVGDYQKIRNNFNRRSCSEIVNYANKIRNDLISQTSIFENFHTNNCKFFNKTLDDDTIETIKHEWNISIDNKLHCFVLKNEMVAEKNSFKSVYDAFSSCTKFEQISTELLSEDEFKLGPIELLFKRIIALKRNISNSKSLINGFIDLKDTDKNKLYKIIDIRNVVNKIKGIKGDVLSDYSQSFFETFKDDKNIIQYVLKDNSIESFENFKTKIAMTLFKNNENPNLDIFLNLKMDELDNWYKYITRNFEDKEVIYQTIHSSKGLQYDNVVISLEDDFAKDHKYFLRFFENYDSEDKLAGDDKRKFLKAQNLLYVGFTRAIKNLFVYYCFNQTNQKLKCNIDKIFNKQIEFKNNL